jgi:hypothetical protein
VELGRSVLDRDR